MNSSSQLCEAKGRISTLLSESIDEVLVNLLGEYVKQTIYKRLDREGLRKHQIPKYLPRFDAFLENNLGRAGAVIERQIARRLYTRLGLNFEAVQHYALTDYVDMAFRLLPRVERLT